MHKTHLIILPWKKFVQIINIIKTLSKIVDITKIQAEKVWNDFIFIYFFNFQWDFLKYKYFVLDLFKINFLSGISTWKSVQKGHFSSGFSLIYFINNQLQIMLNSNHVINKEILFIPNRIDSNIILLHQVTSVYWKE